MCRIGGFVTVMCVAYAAAIVVWQALRLAFGDRWWWLAWANVLSLYLFLPVGGLAPLALLSRRRTAMVAVAVPVGVWLVLYGGLFLPRTAPLEAEEARRLRVMTWNILYLNDDGAAVERIVQAESPDLICLQELTPQFAAELTARLSDRYPYRVLLPAEGVIGQGVFSRYPLRDEGQIPDPTTELVWWAPSAQVVAVEFAGQSVRLLNVHALPPPWPSLSRQWISVSEVSFWLREQEILTWLEWLAQYGGGATIIAGDFNVTDQNRAYRLMARQFHDAHRRAGWGLGHTAPASPEGLDGIPLPSRLFRIDYVWYSDHWLALDVHAGGWDGRSDHLPVVADLVLRSNR